MTEVGGYPGQRENFRKLPKKGYFARTHDPRLELKRFEEWRNSPVFEKAYKDKLHDLEEKAKKKAKYEGKEFSAKDGRAWRESQAAAFVFWNELLKRILQEAASPFVSGIVGLGKQLGGFDGKITDAAKKMGIPITDPKTNDIFIEWSDGTRKFNKNFVHNLGPHAFLLFFVKDAAWMGVQSIMKGGAGMTAGMFLMGIPVVGYIPACLLLMISSKSIVESITVDFAKKLFQMAYHVAVYNFRGKGEAVITMYDMDGELTEEGLEAFEECLSDPNYNPEPVPDKVEQQINQVVSALFPDGKTIDLGTLANPPIALPSIPGISPTSDTSMSVPDSPSATSPYSSVSPSIKT